MVSFTVWQKYSVAFATMSFGFHYLNQKVSYSINCQQETKDTCVKWAGCRNFHTRKVYGLQFGQSITCSSPEVTLADPFQTLSVCQTGREEIFRKNLKLSDRLCGLVVSVLGNRTEVYCVSCKVRTECIHVM
jgi:hypothetical protein